MAHTQRDLKKEAFWRDALVRHASGGLSVREFCRRNKLSEPSFHERRTFQKRDAQQSAAPPMFVPVIVHDDRPMAVEPDACLVVELLSRPEG